MRSPRLAWSCSAASAGSPSGPEIVSILLNVGPHCPVSVDHLQLMTILEENHHSFLIVEHDPMLYEDAKEMVEYVAQALKHISREATILLYAPALDPSLQKMAELANLGVLHLQRAGRSPEGRGEDAGRPEDTGGILMRWPWRLRRAIEPRPMVSRAMEMETAKEILAKVFHAQPGEVEEMIKRRLEERGWGEEHLLGGDSQNR